MRRQGETGQPLALDKSGFEPGFASDHLLILNPASPWASVDPSVKSGSYQGRRAGRVQQRICLVLGIPSAPPHARPQCPFPSPRAESRFLVPGPSAAGSSSNDIRAAGGRREPAEPKLSPSERTAGRPGAQRLRTLAGAQRQPPWASQPAPRRGICRYWRGGQRGRPAFNPGRLGGAAGPCSRWMPSPKEGRGCRGWLDSG